MGSERYRGGVFKVVFIQIKVEKQSRKQNLVYSLEVAGWCWAQMLWDHWVGCCCVLHQMQELEPPPAQPLETNTLYPYGPYPELIGVGHLAVEYKYYSMR